MSRQRNYMQYRFFNRLFLYTTSLLVVVIVLVTSVLYAIFSSAMIEDASRNTQALLLKTSYSADVVRDEVDTLCRALMSDTVIFNYITDSKIEPVEEFLTLRRLNDIVKAYPNIYMVGIYNATVNRYLTNSGVATDPGVDAASIVCLKEDKSTDYITFLPQSLPSWPSANTSTPETPVLTYVIHPGWIIDKSTPSGLVIHIEQRYLQDTVNGLSSSNSENIFVMDKSGVVLTSTQKNRFLSSVANKDYVTKILSQPAGEGSFEFTVDGRRDLISFVRSDTGLYFVNVQSFSQLLENITRIQNLMLAIAAAILLAGTASAFILARRLYNPIDSLLTKLNALPGKNRREDDMELIADAYSRLNNQTIMLQNTIESAIPVFKDAYLRSLLSSPEANLSSAPQLLLQLESTLNGPCFFVILLAIDDLENYRRVMPEEEQKVHLFALGNIAHDIIGKTYENSVVGVGPGEVAVIAQSDAHQPQTLLRLALEDLRGAIRQSFSFRISAAIGDWVDSRASICMSYGTAREYLQYRLYYGMECVIDRSMVIERLNSPGEYPAELDNQLIAAMERQDDEKVQSCVERFFKTVESMSYENAITYINQFLTAPVKHFSSLLNVRGESVQSYYQAVHKITGMPTLQEISEASGKFMVQILDKLQESKNLYSSQKLKSVLDWINENYCDSNISLEIIADRFEISPGYLGRLLYGVTYSHFSDYLNCLRLRKAAELLKNTSLPMEQVCREVGINNTNYFYTLFKKQFRMTPANYRKNSAQL